MDILPLFDTKVILAPLQTQLQQAAARVIQSGNFILGPEVQAFETEWADYCQTKYAVGVANGTDALELALRAIGVKPGDDVVVPSLTFYATAEAVASIGANPVFCDVDPSTGCITKETIKPVLTANTTAIVPVHLFGNPAPMDQILELGIPVVEDAAQSAGSKLNDRPAGGLGQASSFSFFPSKNLGAAGDGGAVVTNDPEVAEQLTMLRFHGSLDRQTHQLVGYNSRLDEIHAAMLRVMLPHLGEWTRGRQQAAGYYQEAGITDLVTPMQATPGSNPAWHLYVVRHPRSDQLIEQLNKQGIESRGYYRVPVHMQPAMRPWMPAYELPGTMELAATNLALPFGPWLQQAHADRVTAAIALFC